jgi:hypothetical protein
VPPGAGPFPGLILNHGSTIEPGTSDVCRPGTAAVLTGVGLCGAAPAPPRLRQLRRLQLAQDRDGRVRHPEYDRALAARLGHEAEMWSPPSSGSVPVPRSVADRIGVIGSSFGGTVSLLAAARAPRLRCAVDFAGAR